MTVQKIKNANNYNNGGGVVFASKTGLTTGIQAPIVAPVDIPSQYIYAYDNPKYEDVLVSSGSPTVVAAVPGRTIRLINYTILSSVAQTVKWQSNTTDLSAGMSLDASGGIAQDSKDGLLQTQPGEALRLLPSTSGVVTGHITYVVR